MSKNSSASTAPGSPSSHWDVLESFSLTPSISVTSYRSRLSGLRVVHAHVPGPLVLGYLTLATESHSNDGCPHTLEHLIFMGSERWPYKGVLDMIANRSLSQGTNAWTDVDHTCYTMDVAGQQGALQLLPVYLDHVLYPTITHSAFLTEVHHVTAEGKDAGVVYCEMEAREHTADDIMSRAVHSALYAGHCGYRSETGGLIADIRELQADTIRAYHAAYYRPDNLSVCIAGVVDQQALFATLARTEQDILSKPPLPPLQRPWSSPVPPFTSSVEQRVLFPSEDEEHGLVHIGWRFTAWRDFYSRTALDLLWTYLASTSLSPLHRAMIEIDRPYAGDLDFSILEKSVGVHLLQFEQVAVERLGEVKDAFLQVVAGIAEGREALDMGRLHSLLRKEIRQTLVGWEEEPHHTVAHFAISNFLYGQESWREEQQERKQEGGSRDGQRAHDKRGDLEREMSVVERLHELLTEDAEFWRGLMRRWILQQPYALIIGVPSKAESARLMQEEKDRLQRQVEQLTAKDAQALSKLGQQLTDAIARNSQPPPDALLEAVPSPDLTRVPELLVYTHRSGPVSAAQEAHNARHPQAAALQSLLSSLPALSSLPVSVQLDHIPSEFAQIRVLLSTADLPLELKALLPLYRDVLFESPVQRESGLLSSEQVVTALEAELVSYDSAMGVSSERFTVGSYGQYATLLLKVEAADYERGLLWARDLLRNLRFTKQRLLVAVKRMLSSIPELKNDGGSLVKAAAAHVNFDERSAQHAVNFIRQQALLKRCQADLSSQQEGAAQRWIDQLKELQRLLSRPEAMHLHIACDWLKQGKSLTATIGSLFSDGGSAAPQDGRQQQLLYSRAFLRPLTDSSHPDPATIVVPVSACRSSYLAASLPLPATFTYAHPDVAPLRLALEYLTTLEGPMWRRIRGLGFSYSYSCRLDVEGGLLVFALFKSTNLTGAYLESESIVHDYAQQRDAASRFRPEDLRAAKSSLGFELLSAGDTLIAAADQSLFTWLKGQDAGYTARLLSAVQAVSLADVEAVMSAWLLRLFDSRQTRLCVVTNPANVQDISAFFADEKRGRKVQELSSVQLFQPAKDGENRETDDSGDEDDGDDDEDEDGDDEDDDEDEDEDDDD